MSKYFCPDCGYEGDEPICSRCHIPAEPLDVSLDETSLNDKYSKDDMESTEDLADDELIDDSQQN